MTAQDYYVISMLAQQRMVDIERMVSAAPAGRQTQPTRAPARVGALAALTILTAAILAIWR